MKTLSDNENINLKDAQLFVARQLAIGQAR
jgi:hypothetical protein